MKAVSKHDLDTSVGYWGRLFYCNLYSGRKMCTKIIPFNSSANGDHMNTPVLNRQETIPLFLKCSMNECVRLSESHYSLCSLNGAAKQIIEGFQKSQRLFCNAKYDDNFNNSVIIITACANCVTLSLWNMKCEKYFLLG